MCVTSCREQHIPAWGVRLKRVTHPPHYRGSSRDLFLDLQVFFSEFRLYFYFHLQALLPSVSYGVFSAVSISYYGDCDEWTFIN